MNAVDTNVLIYLSDTRDQRKRDKSREMVSASVPPVIVWQVASEFIAAARKLKAFGFTQEQAWLQLDQLLRVCPLALPTEHVLARARELESSHQLSHWDAMLYAACIEAGVTTLYSEDVPGSAIDGLTIVNPFIG
ncbi:MAG: PIN domain-containing protein [Phycisphaeraceae bacterium]|nr:PIN domain-containing protein [Phycisphaeraceae bacterium]